MHETFANKRLHFYNGCAIIRKIDELYATPLVSSFLRGFDFLCGVYF